MKRLFHRPTWPYLPAAAGALSLAIALLSIGAVGCTPSAPPGPRRLELAGTTRLGSGLGDARLIVEPDDGVRPIIRALDHAQDRIFVEAYILTEQRIVRALERAAAQGVAVYVLLDRHPFGMGSQPQKLASRLRSAGVSVRWSPARYTYTHAKLLVIDDRLAIVATANLSHSAYTANRELVAFLREPVSVRELSNLFRSDWDGLRYRGGDADLVLSPRSGRVQLTRLLLSARSSVDIYAEEVADPDLDGILIRLVRRVRVRLIVPWKYGSPELQRLVRAGVPVRSLPFPYVHAKAIVVDGREGFVGSENLSATSLDDNREVGVLVQGAALRRVRGVFARDWTRAVRVRPDR